MLRTSYSVLSTIAASAADITTAQGYFSITGCPTIKYSQVANAGFGYVVKATEVLGAITVTPTVSAGIPNTLVITQYRGDLGRTVTEVVSYTPVTGDTATIVCNAWRAQAALYDDLYITFGGTATLTLAARASSATTGYWGSAIISVRATSGTNTVAQTTAAAAITGVTVATETLILTGTTPATGTVVAISGVAGATNTNGVFLVGTVVASTSFGLKDFYTGANIAQGSAWSSGGFWVAGTVPYTASTSYQSQGGQSRGAYWDLVAAGVDATLLTVGKTYNQTIFQYHTREGGAIVTDALNQHTLYVQDDATNYANFATRMGTLLADYAVGGTSADPINLALA